MLLPALTPGMGVPCLLVCLYLAVNQSINAIHRGAMGFSSALDVFFTPFRLLVLFTMINMLNYLDRGIIPVRAQHASICVTLRAFVLRVYTSITHVREAWAGTCHVVSFSPPTEPPAVCVPVAHARVPLKRSATSSPINCTSMAQTRTSVACKVRP